MAPPPLERIDHPNELLFFPDVTDGRATYVSPLTDVLKDLRRKHILAAAASTGKHMSFIREDSEENVGGETCTCQSPRSTASLFGGASFGREDSVKHLHELNVSKGESSFQVCNQCGKKKAFDPIGDVTSRASRKPSDYRRRRSSVLSKNRPNTAAVQHASCLLDCTPHLRHLTPASTDMQGSGNLGSSRGLLGFVSPSPAPTSTTEATYAFNYRTCLARDRANRQAAMELASFLWVLSHEMSLEDYGTVENEVFTSIFAMVHSTEIPRRMAGVAALDALIDTPSADDEKKAIKFGNNLKYGLQAAHADYEFLSAVSRALGHMATRAANVDLVESEVTRALEWLGTERSGRRLAACLTLGEIAVHAPTAFYSITSQSTSTIGGTNQFLDLIFPVIRDPQPVVRACAADALCKCLKILVDRQQVSLTGMLCSLHFDLMEGLQYDPTKKRKDSSQAVIKADAAHHGSLLVIADMCEYTGDFFLPRFDEVCVAVLNFRSHPKALIRLEVIRLLPRLARRCPGVFGRRYLDHALLFLLKCASSPTPPRVGIDLRPTAFTAIGQLVLAMSDSETGRVIGGDAQPMVKILQNPEEDFSPIVEVLDTGIIYDKLPEIFALVRRGLDRARPSSSSRGVTADTKVAALNCGADLVEALGTIADPYVPDLINDMFTSGLSEDLIHCLHAVAVNVPSQQSVIEDRLFQEVSLCLAGTPSAHAICDPMSSFRDDTGDEVIEIPRIQINMSDKKDIVGKIVLSLRTLGSFGDSSGMVTTSGRVFPLLPFVRDVAARYLSHPSSEVRREAALTCCSLLVAREVDTLSSSSIVAKKSPRTVLVEALGSESGRVIEEVLRKLLQVAVSDPTPVVRLCVVRALNTHFDAFLCQAHHLQSMCLVLQDEALATRAAALKMLGRVARQNPAIVLPVMRRFLTDLIIELRCGGDTGRSREEATRLLKVFLRSDYLNRLVQPVLPSIVEALPLRGMSPRLESAALETMGELAQASRSSLRPWVPQLIPHILETMQDQSSASKQRTSLKTLGQIAGSTGYVIRPYLDYPQLLAQATDVLPGTKRAPWELRREVIRTLGILGALDPDQYHAAVPKTRKGGAVGGGYYIDQEYFAEAADTDASGKLLTLNEKMAVDAGVPTDDKMVLARPGIGDGGKRDSSESMSEPGHFVKEADDDSPVHLYMYEQYAMMAQPDASLAPQRRIVPADEDFYPQVTIQALTRIFKDPSLAVHHGMVMQALMFIFKSLGLRCVPYLKQVVPHMVYTIKNCSQSTLREALLKQVATLSGIVKEHLRPYVEDIFDIVDFFWSSRHLETILDLISRIAVGVPDEFRKYVPRLVRKILASIEEIQVSDWLTPYPRAGLPGSGPSEVRKLTMILRSIRSLQGVLGEFLHMLVPALLKLTGSLLSPTTAFSSGSSVTQATLADVAVLTIETVSVLLDQNSTLVPSRIQSYTWVPSDSDSFPRGCSLPARAAQPLIRLLENEANVNRSVGIAIVQALCVCAQLLGEKRWVPMYHDVARKAICDWQIRVGVTNDIASPGANAQADAPNREDLFINGINLYQRVVEGLESPYSPGFQLQTSQSARNLDDSRHRVDAASSLAGPEAIIDNIDGEFPGSPPAQHNPDHTRRHNVNQGNLQRAWDVSQRASREDWDEWMRRFALQLLREAPSPELRATAHLAHAYQPLARELFSAAFVCCWGELSDQYRANLVYALETAFVADVSPEILQTLLNLAEFMEHDGVDNGLPIDISILADLALKCRAYSKALHYKEREYNMGGADGPCVESLISINNKLDLPEAALGVLKATRIRLEAIPWDYDDYEYAQRDSSIGGKLSSKFLRHDQRNEMVYSVMYSTDDIGMGIHGDGIPDFKESWLAKLGSWTEALAVYEEKLRQNPGDFDAILGSMRCLDATGEWQSVLDIAGTSWFAISGTESGEGGHEMEQAPHSFSSMYIAPRAKRKALKFCAQAAWRLGQWTELEKYASQLVRGNQSSYASGSLARLGSLSRSGEERVRVDYDGAFFTAVLHIHRKEWSLAADAIDAARMAMDSRFTALMTESYKRAYPSMVNCQILAEMEEIVAYRKLEGRAAADSSKHPSNRPDAEEARRELLSIWRDRLAGCRVDADVHSPILGVRSLVLGPTDDVEATLTLSELSRQAQRFKLAERVVLDPLRELGANLDGNVFGFNIPNSLNLGLVQRESDCTRNVDALIDRLVTKDVGSFLPHYGPAHQQFSKQLIHQAGDISRLMIQHRLYFAYVKHLWSSDRRDEAMDRLKRLSDVVDLISHCENIENNSMQVACWLELGDWKLEQNASPSAPITDQLQVEALTAFKRATSSSNSDYKAWHSWALLNFRIAQQISESDDLKQGRPSSHALSKTLRNHIVAAVNGFVNAISLGTKRWSASVQQDMLNLLTCLFKYGDLSEVASTINDGIGGINLDTWLGVLPQLLARIHIRQPSVRSVLHPLLTRLGEKHPQALMYPLSVLLKSPVAERKTAAESLMTSLKAHSSALVEEALLVSSELIRVAILWVETWHEGLEDASRLYFGDHNVQGMLDVLIPLHDKVERGPETAREEEFIRSFGRDLSEARAYVEDYIRLTTQNGGSVPASGVGQQDQSGRLIRESEEAETALNKAWDIYYTIFRRINKLLPQLRKLELSQCSPALSNARNLELGVPGSYRVDGSYVKIEQFVPSVDVINSKQRPRKITLRGSDGNDYVFLLKGHEDLRQDERVMQLFGLVNALLARDRQTKKQDLNIQRYAISPLSHDCGLVGWVPHCDTLHSLIRDYREGKIPLNMENRAMLSIAPDYEQLTVMQKVEVFTEGLKRTQGNGNDLYEILWLKSSNSEEWLEHRTKYTRSLAVMSMVGYILGLGDRHPSNLMIDKLSGRVLHIDFGDCFEVAMHREKYPELIPFRLTRMLVKAMEVSGIEGSYRSTCERTMTVLRESRDSLVAMLEAFVYDPLISWRLVGLSESKDDNGPSIEELRDTTDVVVNPADSLPEDRVSGAPADLTTTSVLHESIAEGFDEDDNDDDAEDVIAAANEENASVSQRVQAGIALRERAMSRDMGVSASRARSLQMYNSMQEMAAENLAGSRIASLVGEGSEQVVVDESVARSRIARSLRQREVMSLLEGQDSESQEEFLNEKALKVIRRVQDKLSGTDFSDTDDVPDQVQRLIVQATSTENLCQLFIGWCAFW